MAAVRFLEWTFVFYCLAHIPLLLFVDLHPLMPGVYPPSLSKIFTWYITTFKDPLMANPEPWLLSIRYMEAIPELIFFPVAAYAFWKGNCKWIRSPVMIYAAHAITVVVACQAQVMFGDFSKTPGPRPKTQEERLTLCAAFAPFLVVPLLMLLLVLFSPKYNQVEKEKKQ